MTVTRSRCWKTCSPVSTEEPMEDPPKEGRNERTNAGCCERAVAAKGRRQSPTSDNTLVIYSMVALHPNCSSTKSMLIVLLPDVGVVVQMQNFLSLCLF